LLQVLQGGVLKDLLQKLPQVERYTYNFQGNAQALDHMYVSASLQERSQVDVMHVNSGVEDSLQTSDHDPIYAIVRPPPLLLEQGAALLLLGVFAYKRAVHRSHSAWWAEHDPASFRVWRSWYLHRTLWLRVLCCCGALHPVHLAWWMPSSMCCL
jgi:hypothetical protein